MWSEIYTSECRKMQLRVFIKTKFPGGTCPRTPSETSRIRLSAFRFIVLLCIGQILGLDPGVDCQWSNSQPLQTVTLKLCSNHPYRKIWICICLLSSLYIQALLVAMLAVYDKCRHKEDKNDIEKFPETELTEFAKSRHRWWIASGWSLWSSFLQKWLIKDCRMCLSYR